MILHYETISESMHDVLQKLMQIPELSSFRLVGGTSLSLQLGHRKSVDIDLFTDKTCDFSTIAIALQKHFTHPILIHNLANGQTWSFNDVKVDIYDWKVPFLHLPIEQDGIRLASLEDIAAYKFEAIASRKSEKDFIDIAEILKRCSFQQILLAFQKRYSYIQPSAIVPILLEPEAIVRDETIVMLNDETFETVGQRIRTAIKNYEEEKRLKAQSEMQDRDARLAELLKRKKK